MTIERKVGMGIAGQPSGGAADVAEVFSTYLYTGTGGAQSINNGIDLAGEGGLVWIKGRNQVYSHQIFDTERGATQRLEADGTGGQVAKTNSLTSFNSNGFSLGSENDVNSGNPYDFASWTFRNSKKFFKAVTFSYGGSSASPTVVTHDLGCTVGMTFVKQTNGNQNWYVQHKDVTGTDNNGALNLTIPFTGGNGQSTSFTSITDTQATFGAAASFPAGTYVAYFFADNSSEDAEEQMIKCGSYTGNGSGTGNVVNLGWEPQWIMIKNASYSSSASHWILIDNMRGMVVGGDDGRLYANNSNSETYGSMVAPTSTGFNLTSTSITVNRNNDTYIYMAIRAPMMKEPEAATDVFAVDAAGSGVAPAWESGFPVDFAIYRDVVGSAGAAVGTRMLGNNELFANTNAAVAASGAVQWDYSNGFYDNTSRSANYYSWMWKRAKGYMDVVCYSGNATAGRAIPHSLGVAPEIVLLKSRGSVQNWYFLNASTGGNFLLNTSSTDQGQPQSYWGDGTNYVAPTASNFTIGSRGQVNASNVGYIAYLFATLDGISKVGGYTGNGSSQTISCGFSAGSRYILIKRTDVAGDWFFWDSLRGIVAGNDPHLSLNTTAAQVTTDDSVDPHNSGFIVNQVSATNINVSSGTYIFYAIA